MVKRKFENFLPIIYLIFGIYFLNFGVSFMSVPSFVNSIDKWIVSFGGIVFFIAFYRSIVYSKRRLLRRAARV